jgi:hypothetical protein
LADRDVRVQRLHGHRDPLLDPIAPLAETALRPAGTYRLPVAL